MCDNQICVAISNPWLEHPMAVRRKLRRRIGYVGLAVFVTYLLFMGRANFLWVRAWLNDKPVPNDTPAGHLDDASRLNATSVVEVVPVESDPVLAEVQLRGLLERASRDRLKVSIAGSRHSMGGHTIAPNGIVVDMRPFRGLELNEDATILTAGSGARWSEIVPYLDARHRSVAVMQSNNDFTVGGSISVNCHGWQHNHAPIASTIESFRVMRADGTIVRCARDEHRELFSLVLGGYGLFGIILDVRLRVVPNERYRPEVELIEADEYAKRFAERVNGTGDIGMVYGRLCVAPGEQRYLREALMTVFRRVPCAKEEIPALSGGGARDLQRHIFRAQIASDKGKLYRWRAEKNLAAELSDEFVSRNRLLNDASTTFQERNADRTDILHEYFIPPAFVPHFLARAREIIPKHDCDLLNVTVRNVLKDDDTFLRYASEELFSFVMLFNQERTPDADQVMASLTRELIDAALECGGRHYLPYRLHATHEQFNRAYPQAAEFFEQKRKYDAEELFVNQFYLKYGRR
jgi:FAD/FMN-containing dehydrogenase